MRRVPSNPLLSRRASSAGGDAPAAAADLASSPLEAASASAPAEGAHAGAAGGSWAEDQPSPGDGGAAKGRRPMHAARRLLWAARRAPLPASLLALALLALALLALALLGGSPPFEPLARPRYDVIIDAGSTGSRVHVYEFVRDRGTASGASGAASRPALRVLTAPTRKVSPGLSAYASDPAAAAASVRELLQFATGRVPAAKQAQTRVRLMATAGLRLLPEADRRRLMDAVAAELAASPFRFAPGGAAVISGRDEALYGWAALAHAAGSADVGLLEVGGASAQIAIGAPHGRATGLAGGSGASSSVALSLWPGSRQEVVAVSWLGLGMDSAHQAINAHLARKAAAVGTRARQHPCVPVGRAETAGEAPRAVALEGAGDFAACRRLVDEVLLGAGCESEVDRVSPCVAGVRVPPLRTAPAVWATENALYTADYLHKAGLLDGFDPSLPTPLSALEGAAAAHCARPWAAIEARARGDEGELFNARTSCFSAALVSALLARAGATDEIRFANKVSDTTIEWALGALVLGDQATKIPRAALGGRGR